MSIKINNLNSKVEFPDYYGDEFSELGKYDLKEIPNDVDEIWYTYKTGSYEGNGHIILRKGDQYCESDMGHCSCYGPCDRLEFKWAPFEELLNNSTTDYQKLLKPMIEYIKANK